MMPTTKHMRRWFFLAIFHCVVCTSMCFGEEDDSISRPVPADGGPTKVYVAMRILDIDEVDGAQQNFTANLIVTLRWHDPRLAHDGSGEIVRRISKVWSPILLFVNQQKIWPTMPEVVHIAPGGEVDYAQRVWGPFSQPLDVREFPFDRQELEVRLAAADGNAQEVVFEADPERVSGLAPKFSLPDWEIQGWSIDFSPYKPMGASRSLASFAMVVQVRRYVSHYVVKVILPLILIVAMSWIVFWIDPDQSSTQIGVATTSMLTLIAYRFMVGGAIPPVPYLTRMDHFILGSTFLVFAALLQAVATSIMAHRKKMDRARKTDKICRVIFPLTFAVMLLYSFVLMSASG
jgi:hypothetical protein